MGGLCDEKFGRSGRGGENEMVGGDGSDTGLMKKVGKQKSMVSIGVSLTPNYRGKEENNNFPDTV